MSGFTRRGRTFSVRQHNLTLLQVYQDAILETRERVERAGSTAAKA
jgi:hypothetical protein